MIKKTIKKKPKVMIFCIVAFIMIAICIPNIQGWNPPPRFLPNPDGFRFLSEGEDAPRATLRYSISGFITYDHIADLEGQADYYEDSRQTEIYIDSWLPETTLQCLDGVEKADVPYADRDEGGCYDPCKIEAYLPVHAESDIKAIATPLKAEVIGGVSTKSVGGWVDVSCPGDCSECSEHCNGWCENSLAHAVGYSYVRGKMKALLPAASFTIKIHLPSRTWDFSPRGFESLSSMYSKICIYNLPAESSFTVMYKVVLAYDKYSIERFDGISGWQVIEEDAPAGDHWFEEELTLPVDYEFNYYLQTELQIDAGSYSGDGHDISTSLSSEIRNLNGVTVVDVGPVRD